MKVFPRTRHLAWTGYASNDDLRLSEHESTLFLSRVTTIQEKLDGANVSFHTLGEGLAIENRGKPVSHHPQFDLLKAWTAEHAIALNDLGSRILYGEWLFATHGTTYDRLPDWFIAYDLYDTTTESFLPTNAVTQFCQEHGLATSTPLAWTKPLTPALLHQLASERSTYSTTSPREGLYLRAETTTRCTDRAKLVRTGYHPRTDEDWHQRGLIKNTRAKERNPLAIPGDFG